MGYKKATLTQKQKGQLIEKLRIHASRLHAAAAWGFAPEGFWMDKAADLIEDYETFDEGEEND